MPRPSIALFLVLLQLLLLLPTNAQVSLTVTITDRRPVITYEGVECRLKGKMPIKVKELETVPFRNDRRSYIIPLGNQTISEGDVVKEITREHCNSVCEGEQGWACYVPTKTDCNWLYCTDVQDNLFDNVCLCPIPTPLVTRQGNTITDHSPYGIRPQPQIDNEEDCTRMLRIHGNAPCRFDKGMCIC